jgi:hypothetical protein
MERKIEPHQEATQIIQQYSACVLFEHQFLREKSRAGSNQRMPIASTN